MNLRETLENKINQKTKPPGSLGQLEKIALQVGLIQKTNTPSILNPHIVVFAADHGISASGAVNPYPQSVTAQMVQNFVNGGAAINVFCGRNHITLEVVDAGVNTIFDAALPILHASIGKGTNDYRFGNAMHTSEAETAINKGKEIVTAIHNKECNCIGFGEMGIGNTSSSALILHYYTKLSIEDCVGNGTGTNAEQLLEKKKVLNEVSVYHSLNKKNISALELLSNVGGYEIAMMTGAYLAAKENDMIIVVDGFISTAALMVAHHIHPDVLSNCIFAHCSDEAGHKKMLQYLKAQPLLQIGLRLGEGTGAALAMPLIQSAVDFLNDMASFESAGISNSIG